MTTVSEGLIGGEATLLSSAWSTPHYLSHAVDTGGEVSSGTIWREIGGDNGLLRRTSTPPPVFSPGKGKGRRPRKDPRLPKKLLLASQQHNGKAVDGKGGTPVNDVLIDLKCRFWVRPPQEPSRCPTEKRALILYTVHPHFLWSFIETANILLLSLSFINRELN